MARRKKLRKRSVNIPAVSAILSVQKIYDLKKKPPVIVEPIKSKAVVPPEPLC